MRRIVVVALLAAVLFSWGNAAVAGNPPAPLSTPELRQIIAAGTKNTIVFFLNPQGGPCRAQNEILQKLLKDRGGRFNIAYVSTLDPRNEKTFYDYGIRALPSLVIVDRRGKIARFFPPGIQSYETLASALDGIK